MYFSRIVSFFTVFMTLFIFALGSPVEVNKRQDVSSIEDILNSLKSQTDSILPQIQGADQTPDALTPLLNELIGAINSAGTSVNRMQKRSVGELDKRQLDIVATLLAGIITDIVTVLSGIPLLGLGLATLLAALDTALLGLITGLSVLLVGLGALLGGLLSAVGGLLAGLGLAGLLGIIGILGL